MKLKIISIFQASLKLIFFISFISCQSSCLSNLNCNETACCKNNLCVSTNECIKDTQNIYIAIGCVGFVFLVGTFIYFIISIRITRENVRKIKEKLSN